MNPWAILGLVLATLTMIGVLVSLFGSMPAGQVAAALASVTVATIGLFVFFKKSKN